MSYQFKIGQTVKIIKSNNPERIGVVTTIASDLFRYGDKFAAFSKGWEGLLTLDSMVHILDLVPISNSGALVVVYPPEYLEPWWDGKESGEWTEQIRSLCGLKQKKPEKV